MLMVAPKAQIAYPQVWRRKDKPWPYKDAPGLAPALKHAWGEPVD